MLSQNNQMQDQAPMMQQGQQQYQDPSYTNQAPSQAESQPSYQDQSQYQNQADYQGAPVDSVSAAPTNQNV